MLVEQPSDELGTRRYEGWRDLVVKEIVEFMEEGRYLSPACQPGIKVIRGSR